MREIKFRGRKSNGEWLYGDLVHNVGVGASTALIFPEDAHDSWDRYIILTDTIGQFTGLLDKNGKEIYEGDVVSYRYSIRRPDSFVRNEINYIGFRQSECKFIVVCKNRHHDLHEPYNLQVEVIGNIHDNPELLTLNK